MSLSEHLVLQSDYLCREWHSLSYGPFVVYGSYSKVDFSYQLESRACRFVFAEALTRDRAEAMSKINYFRKSATPHLYQSVGTVLLIALIDAACTIAQASYK